MNDTVKAKINDTLTVPSEIHPNATGYDSLEIYAYYLTGKTLMETAEFYQMSLPSVRGHIRKAKESNAEIQEFRDNKVNMLENLLHRVLGQVTPEKLEKASSRDLVTCVGIITDKLQLLTGKATHNVAVSTIIKSYDEIMDGENS